MCVCVQQVRGWPWCDNEQLASIMNTKRKGKEAVTKGWNGHVIEPFWECVGVSFFFFFCEQRFAPSQLINFCINRSVCFTSWLCRGHYMTEVCVCVCVCVHPPPSLSLSLSVCISSSLFPATRWSSSFTSGVSLAPCFFSLPVDVAAGSQTKAANGSVVE